MPLTITKPPNRVQQYGVERMTIQGHEFNAHLRFSQPFFETGEGSATMYVALHLGCYFTGLSHIMEMAEALQARIPFPFKFASGKTDLKDNVEIHILGGDRYKHMPSVQFQIRFDCRLTDPNEVDVQQVLRDDGWYQGLESTI